MRYVRVYVRGVKTGNLGIGSREVFVVDEDTLYPEVYSVATGTISNLIKDDFESAEDREVTPKMAESILRVLDSRKPAVDHKDQIAEMEIRAYCRKALKPVATRVRQRVRKQEVAEVPRTRVRTRTKAPETKTRTRTRSRK